MSPGRKQPHTGFSGATLVVHEDITLKRGIGCRDQGEYARQLGVGPRILELLDDGYIMETLPRGRDIAEASPSMALRTAMDILYHDVWGEHSLESWDWHTPFDTWAVHVYGQKLLNLKDAIYPKSRQYFMCRIHGDPTLSNIMYTADGKMRLIDPLRPKGKIPGFIGVDLGKMMQSVIGWEHVAYGWKMPMCRAFIVKLSETEQRVAMFWLAVHALRILPYAAMNDDRVRSWANAIADMIIRHFDWGQPCSMLSTLMELSRTHGKRS